jgi:hypothetical protein
MGPPYTPPKLAHKTRNTPQSCSLQLQARLQGPTSNRLGQPCQAAGGTLLALAAMAALMRRTWLHVGAPCAGNKRRSDACS